VAGGGEASGGLVFGLQLDKRDSIVMEKIPMDHTTLLFAQLMDVFRIGLIAGLIYTMERTRQQTGVIVPLLAGIVFIAVILATTMPVPDVPVWRSIVSGLAANAITVAVLWLIWSMIKKRS
jgi:hypothetical protein